MCLNAQAWRAWTKDGYQLSDPITENITNLLFIDDLKQFEKSSKKLPASLLDTSRCLEDACLEMRERKCATAHIVREKKSTGEELQLESKLIRALKDVDCYKLLQFVENDNYLVDNVWAWFGKHVQKNI